MQTLRERKSKLRFETSDEIRERGRLRAVLVEAGPDVATLRLKGTRHRLTLTWAGIYNLAAKCEADRKRAERLAKKKEKNPR